MPQVYPVDTRRADSEPKAPIGARMRSSHASSSLPIVNVMLKPGDKAPDFTLLDQHGEPFSCHSR